MECCKMLAAILIVFAHVPFPGVIAELINCYVRAGFLRHIGILLLFRPR